MSEVRTLTRQPRVFYPLHFRPSVPGIHITLLLPPRPKLATLAWEPSPPLWAQPQTPAIRCSQIEPFPSPFMPAALPLSGCYFCVDSQFPR